MYFNGAHSKRDGNQILDTKDMIISNINIPNVAQDALKFDAYWYS